jgi:hypothetical protein
MKTLRRHWYNIGIAVAILAGIYLVFAWSEISILQRLLILNFIAILIHQFEEYGFPGGEPAIMNVVLQNSEIPDRYPLNQNSAMITNLLATYVFYLVPVFLPNVIWLGLAPMLFGVGQLAVHGVMTNKKLKSFYNPGLGAVVLLHIPLAVYYIYYIQNNGIAGIMDWAIAIVYLVIYMFFMVNKLTYSWLADKNSKYPFVEEEMKRFNIQKNEKK